MPEFCSSLWYDSSHTIPDRMFACDCRVPSNVLVWSVLRVSLTSRCVLGTLHLPVTGTVVLRDTSSLGHPQPLHVESACLGIMMSVFP